MSGMTGVKMLKPKTIQCSAREVFDACLAVSEDLEVNFESGKITIYWHTLRIDVQPEDFGKALKVIKDAVALGAQFVG